MLHMKDEYVPTTEERRQGQHGQLRLARERRGWTQKELADLIDLPDSRTLRRWECGESSPSLRYRARLCKLFEMSAEELNLVQDNHAPDDERRNQPHSEPTQPIYEPIQPTPEPSPPMYEEDDLNSHHKLIMFPSLDHWNRQQLLHKVQIFWIKGILEQSFQETGYLSLQFCTQPDAVSNAWTEIIQPPDCSCHPLPPGTHITQVYDNACGELLILGEPGSGKTLLLLELTRDLLARAFANEAHPMPVIFNLSSWTPKWHSLATWLVEELSQKYQAPKRLGQEWVDNDRILPLLDGLDEVHPSYRKTCADAITAYRREHGLVPLVVCSRKEEYVNLSTRILLQQAICIQSLTPCQLNDCIARAGKQSSALQSALSADSHLPELITTPLMLALLLSAYQSQPNETLKRLKPVESRRKHFIATYVECVLKRRTQEPVYTLQQCSHWLAFLARQMKQNGQVAFSSEHIQLDWLPTRRVPQIYHGLLVKAMEAESRTGQMALHFLLRLGGYIPWNFTRFLDFAIACGLLHRIGRGYVFAHPFLLEYFATLDQRETDDRHTKHAAGDGRALLRDDALLAGQPCFARDGSMS